MSFATAKLTLKGADFLPIDPTAIAQDFGARVVTRPPRGQDQHSPREHGALSVQKGHWTIEVPLDISVERRRFSIAHEIAHILLFDAVADNPLFIAELKSAHLWREVERLCNLAAAQLLMPARAVARQIELESGLSGSSALETLSSRFFVSYEAFARRASELYDEHALIIWEYTLDHPRGPAWRTAKTQDRSRRGYVPPGLSASRLSPDVISVAAKSGYSAEDSVRFDSPGANRLTNVRAFRNRSPRLLQLDELTPSPGSPHVKDRVYLFGRQSKS